VRRFGTMHHWIKKIVALLLSQRTLMLFCFVSIAFIAWFVNRLSNEYRAELLLNVCIYNSQNEQSPKMYTTTPIPVVARATGLYIVRQRLSKPPIVFIDIKNKRLRQSGAQYYMLTSSLQDEIRQLLSDDMHIESYDNDTLYFYGVQPEEITTDGTVYGGNTVNFFPSQSQ
jgi:hypothetical protein